tara:strand:+ start:339 stop:500 length:162 start_codon:yes stop_codon:yes gene_type:complete
MELKIINNQIIEKIQLEYILKIIENDMEKLEEGEEEELKMIQDLYRKLVILNK